MVSIKSGVTLWCKPCYKIMLNYDNENKCGKLQQFKVGFLWL